MKYGTYTVYIDYNKNTFTRNILASNITSVEKYEFKFKTFVPNALFLYPMKTSENLKVF